MGNGLDFLKNSWGFTDDQISSLTKFITNGGVIKSKADLLKGAGVTDFSKYTNYIAGDKTFDAIKQITDTTKQATDAAKDVTDAATKTDWGGILSGAGDVMAGIGALGSVGLGIYSAIENKKQMEEQLKLARENFNFQKGLANRNLTNQAKAYNQEVGARSALAAAYDRSNPNAQANYYDRWRVSEAGVGQAENYKNPYQNQTQGNK